MLILSILAVPAAGIITLLVLRFIFSLQSNKVYAAVSLAVGAIVFALASILLMNTLQQAPITFKISLGGPFSPYFYVDLLSCILIMVTAFLWLAVSIYLSQYMVYEGGAAFFHISTLATLFAVLGIFLAGNLFTMLLFFETMTVSSYFWVIHKGDKKAIRAGNYYLFFSIFGGFIITLGIALMGIATQTLPDIGTIAAPINEAFFNWGIIALIIGFGVKAGMVPLHLWLPHAHSAAPAPGSALLSGLLIKVGAYGVIRTVAFMGLGAGSGLYSEKIAIMVSILGAVSMLVGVIAALLQSNAKRLLAYHSVSQMGYIFLSIGIALYLGDFGGLSLIGAIYHIINHALFKSALFLGVGIIYIRAKEINLYKLGALLREMPVLAMLMLLSALGITGAPGLNGYISKNLMHHGLNIAASGGQAWLGVIERLFTTVGIGTAASFAKLYYLAFIKKPNKRQAENEQSAKAATKSLVIKKELNIKDLIILYIPMALLTAGMLFIGFFPKVLLSKVIVPAVHALGMQDAAAAVDFKFWNLSDFISAFVTLVLGVIVCSAGLKTGAFHWHAPAWLTIEGVFGFAVRRVYMLAKQIVSVRRKITRYSIRLFRLVRLRLISGLNSLICSRNYTAYKLTFIGISADAALLMMVLMILVAGYTVGAFNIGGRVLNLLSVLCKGRV